jgi:hypothetical protein
VHLACARWVASSQKLWHHHSVWAVDQGSETAADWPVMVDALQEVCVSTPGDRPVQEPAAPVAFTKQGTPEDPASGQAPVPPSQQPLLVPYGGLPGQRQSMGAGRIVVIVLAALLSLFGLAVAAGGGVLAWAHASRDSSGFLTTGVERLSTPTAVLSSDNVNIQVEGTSWFTDHLGTLHIEATATNGKPLFIGIGPLADVRSWLGPASTDQVRDLHFAPFSVDYFRQPGTLAAVAAPGTQKFWTARSTGATTQTLNWKITNGSWAIVVANADGSPGVDVNARLGAKFSWLGPLSIALIIIGIVLLLIGLVVIVVALRGRRKIAQPWPGQPPGLNP